VLVTEYLHGARLLDAARHHELGADPNKLAQMLAGARRASDHDRRVVPGGPSSNNILALPEDASASSTSLTKELPDDAGSVSRALCGRGRT
jgi:hypothetical protein